jgi:type I restriction enzyme, R subunit
MPLNEADTCRVYVTPRLRDAGWETEPHSLSEQYGYTDGRIRIVDGRPVRGERKRADYLLRYLRDLPIATVEAKPEDAPRGLRMGSAGPGLADGSGASAVCCATGCSRISPPRVGSGSLPAGG